MYKYLWIVFIIVSCFGNAQNMFTYRFSEFSGIHGVLENPSDFANSSLQYDVNIFSMETFAFNNYVFIEDQSVFSTISNFIQGNELISLTQDNIDDGKDTAQFALVDRPITTDKYVDLNIEVLGPSLVWNKNGIHNFGISTRFRAVTDVQDIHYAMAVISYEGIRYRPLHNQDFLEPYGRIQTMSWGEVGFHYSTNIVSEPFFRLAFGGALKRLYGYEAAYVEFEDFQFRLQEQAVNDLFVDLQVADGTLKYGRTDAVNPAIPGTRNSRGKGWGLDIGFTAIGKGVSKYTNLRSNSVYKWKAGIALTDFGRINFRENARRYLINEDNVDYIRFDEIEFPGLNEFDSLISEELLGHPDSSFIGNGFTMNLPRTVRMHAEYRPIQRLSIGMNAQIGLGGRNFGVYYPDVVSLHSQYGFRWFDISASASLLEYNFFRMGSAIRLGPFFVGTDDLLAYFVPQELSSFSLYFGFKFSKDRPEGNSNRRRRPKKLKVNKCMQW